MNTNLSAEQWQQVKTLFNRAVELAGVEREVFLAHIENQDLRGEVRELLAADDDDESLLEHPAFDLNDFELPLIGGRLGHYKIIEEIGRGGMGAVYLARRDDGEFQQQVAIKLVRGGINSDFVLRRFRIEREILAALEHPHIARLLDGGTTADGAPYLVMEYVAGVPVDRFCVEQNLNVAQKLELFRQIAAAVQYAHSRLVIHRDLKPSNILIAADGTPKLLDFGIAKLLSDGGNDDEQQTATQFGMMTPAYASPEQLRGEKLTTATDVYSLGVVLYELLTGARPHQTTSANINEMLRAINETEPTRPSEAATTKLQNHETAKFKLQNLKLLRGDVDNIVLKALRREPERRYSSVEQFSEDIRRHLAGLPILARPDTFGYRAQKFARRNRASVTIAALLILALVGGIAATAWQAVRAERQRVLAEQRFGQVRQIANKVIFKYYDQIKDLQGATKARETIVADAADYLDNLGSETDDTNLQTELSAAYQRIGDIQGAPFEANLGDTAGAIANYRKALAMLDDANRKLPDEIKVIEQQRDAHKRLSLILLRANAPEAAEHYRQSIALSERIMKDSPADVHQSVMLAESYVNLCRAVPPGLNANQSVEICRQAVPILQQAEARNPQDVVVIAGLNAAHNQLGAQYTALADGTDHDAEPQKAQELYQTAGEHFAQAAATAEQLVELEPANARYRRRLFAARFNESLAERNSGKAAAALTVQQAMLTEATRAAQDRDNAEAQHDLITVVNEMGLTYIELKDFDRADRQFRQALEMFDKLISQDRANAETQRDKFETYLNVGNALAAKGDLDKARIAFRAAAAFAQTAPALKNTPFEFYAEGATHKKIGDCWFAASENKKTPAAKRESLTTARAEYEKTLQNWQQPDHAPENFGQSDNQTQVVKQSIAECDKLLK